MQNTQWPQEITKKYPIKDIYDFFLNIFNEDIIKIKSECNWIKTCISEGKNKSIALNIYENDEIVDWLTIEYDINLISKENTKWYGIEYLFEYPKDGKIIKRNIEDN